MTWSLFHRKPRMLSVSEGYERWALSYAQEDNPIKRLSDEAVADLLPLQLTGKVILDAGCGSGALCALAERRGATTITGIDLSPRMIAAAGTATKHTMYRTGDLLEASFEPEAYDIVLCALVLGHFRDITPALAKLVSALRPSGMLILTEFHPHQTAGGARRTFRDTANDKVYEIRHYLHPLQEYRERLNELGCSIGEWREPTWKEAPVVFALRGTRTSPSR